MPVFIVRECEAGLLYYDGLFQRRLDPGRHRFWSPRYHMKRLDMRKLQFVVNGQEVLTADNISIKISLLMTYRIVDPVRSEHETDNYFAYLYNAAQLALRDAIGAMTAEDALGQRAAISRGSPSGADPKGKRWGWRYPALRSAT